MSNRKLGAAPCATLPGMFRVSWSCDVEAADYEAAAEAARQIKLLGGAAVFAVEQFPDARQGALMLGLGARRVALDPAPDAKRAKPAAAARRVPGSKAGENFRAQPGQVFAEGLRAACRAAVAEHGLGWSFVTGASVLLRVPGALASYKSERGTRISIRRDLRAPAARYWPGGEIPAAAAQFAPYTRSWRGKVLCPDGSKTPAYRRWLKAWKASPAAHAPTEESRFWAWIAAQPKGDEYRHDPAEQAAPRPVSDAENFRAPA
jgi:hypothetical protein